MMVPGIIAFFDFLLFKKGESMRSFLDSKRRLGAAFGFGLAIFLSQVSGYPSGLGLSPEVALAQSDNDESRPLNDRYDSAIARAEARYHQAVANARKAYLENKRKADALYARKTAVASRHVTGTINDIKNKLAETGGSMGEQVTTSIKAAVANYAKTISSDFRERQKEVKKAVDAYVKALGDATQTFQKDVSKANGKLSSGDSSK